MKKWKILNNLTTLVHFAGWFFFVIVTFMVALATHYNLITFQSTYAGQKIQNIPIEVLVFIAYIFNAAVFIFILCYFPAKIMFDYRTYSRITNNLLNMTLAVKIQEEFNAQYPNYKGYLTAHIKKSPDNDPVLYALELNLKDAVIIKDHIMIPGENELEERGIFFWNELSGTFTEMVKSFECTHTTDE